MDVTICTLVRDRTEHLVAQVRGLLASASAPAAHVVAVMGGEDPRSHVPTTPWPTRFVDVPADDGLPLARARNTAAVHAHTPGLVMLDVDCIPAPGLVGAYATALDDHDAILMGEVRYLPADWRRGTPPAVDPDTLAALAVAHPSRPAPPDGFAEVRPTDDHHLFWSLAFAVRTTTLVDRVGGFDEGFTGYGAEDTDLAFRARARGVGVAWVGGALAFHQHHDVHDPPLHHAASIVANARRFRDVWGRWPMEGWLAAFAELGIVAWTPDGDRLELLRSPTADELAATHRTAPVPTPTRSDSRV